MADENETAGATANAAKNTGTTTDVGGLSDIGMRLCRSWEVKMPPPSRAVFLPFQNKTMIETGLGHLNFIQKARRICIEIHGPEQPKNSNEAEDRNDDDDDDDDAEDEADDVGEDDEDDDNDKIRQRGRRMETQRKLLRRAGTGGRRQLVDISTELKDDDLVVIRILKPRRGRWGLHVDENDSETDDHDDDDNDNGSHNNKDDTKSPTASAINISTTDGTAVAASTSTSTWLKDLKSKHHNSYSNNRYALLREMDDWIQYRKFGLDEIQDDDEQYRKTWIGTIGLPSVRERRKLIFATYEQAEEFKQEIDKLRALTRQRAAQRLLAYKKLQNEIKRRIDGALAVPVGTDARNTIGTGPHNTTTTEINRQQQQDASSPFNLNAAVSFLNPINIVHKSLDLLPFEVINTNISGQTGAALREDSDSSTRHLLPPLGINIEKINPKLYNKLLSQDNHGNNNNSATINLDDDINLLVEIVSCSDLPISDIISTDPYVSVYLGVNPIHHTDVIFKE